MIAKFVKRLLLFLLPLAVLLPPLELYLRSIPNAYKLKNDYMLGRAQDIETLILGSSHSYRAMDAKRFATKALNAAYSSQDLKRDCFIFDKYAAGMDSLKNVVMSVSYFSFAEMTEDLSAGETLLKYYGIYMGYPPNRCSLELTIPNWTEKLKLHLKGTGVVECDSLGFGDKRINKLRSPLNLRDASITAASHTHGDTAHYAENMDILRHMASECCKRGVRLVLVTLPASDLYRSCLDSVQLSSMYSHVRSLQQEFPDVVYLDYLSDTRFDHSDFYDADHLSLEGAEKFTEIFTDTLGI